MNRQNYPSFYKNDVNFATDMHWGEIKRRRRIIMTPELYNTIIAPSEKYVTPKEIFSEHKFFPNMVDPNFAVHLPPNIFPLNEYIRHTSKLNLYCKKLQGIIKVLMQMKYEFRGPSVYDARKIPEMISRSWNMEKPKNLNFDIGSQQLLWPDLEDRIIQLMLEKSLRIILLHNGFEKVESDAFFTLYDLMRRILTKICSQVYAFGQRDLNRGHADYYDVLDKAFTNSGFSGLTSIQDYYTNKVFLEHSRAKERAKRTLHVYETLMTKYGFFNENDPAPVPVSQRNVTATSENQTSSGSSAAVTTVRPATIIQQRIVGSSTYCTQSITVSLSSAAPGMTAILTRPPIVAPSSSHN